MRVVDRGNGARRGVWSRPSSQRYVSGWQAGDLSAYGADRNMAHDRVAVRRIVCARVWRHRGGRRDGDGIGQRLFRAHRALERHSEGGHHRVFRSPRCLSPWPFASSGFRRSRSLSDRFMLRAPHIAYAAFCDDSWVAASVGAVCEECHSTKIYRFKETNPCNFVLRL